MTTLQVDDQPSNQRGSLPASLHQKTAVWRVAAYGAAAVVFVLALWFVVDRHANPAKQIFDALDGHGRIGPARKHTERSGSLVSQRKLDAARFLAALEGKPKAPVQILYTKDDRDAFQLALQFQSLLTSATWLVSDLKPISGSEAATLAGQPSYIASGEGFEGVAVAVRADSQREFALYDDRQANTPLNALLEAILETLGSVAINAAGAEFFPAPPPGTLRIVVGARPSN